MIDEIMCRLRFDEQRRWRRQPLNDYCHCRRKSTFVLFSGCSQYDITLLLTFLLTITFTTSPINCKMKFQATLSSPLIFPFEDYEFQEIQRQREDTLHAISSSNKTQFYSIELNGNDKMDNQFRHHDTSPLSTTPDPALGSTFSPNSEEQAENMTLGSPNNPIPRIGIGIIDAIWDGLYRPNIFGPIILSLAYTLIFIIGIVGNTFVVTIVCRSPKMRTVTNIFIANLALADILVLVLCLPATLISNIFVPWVLGEFVCKAVSYLQGVAVSASINTMVAVTVDRFCAICFPMGFHLSRRNARWTIAGIWAFSLAIALPWAIFFGLHDFTYEKERLNGERLKIWYTLSSCQDEWPENFPGSYYFVVANLIMLYLLPAVIILICYTGILIKLNHRSIPGDRPIDEIMGRDHKVQNIMNRSKIRVVKMMMVVVISFLALWSPLYIIFFRIKLGSSIGENEEIIIRQAMPAAQWLGSTNSCINPILYTFFNRRFKRGFIDLFTFGLCFRRRPFKSYFSQPPVRVGPDSSRSTTPARRSASATCISTARMRRQASLPATAPCSSGVTGSRSRNRPRKSRPRNRNRNRNRNKNKNKKNINSKIEHDHKSGMLFDSTTTTTSDGKMSLSKSTVSISKLPVARRAISSNMLISNSSVTCNGDTRARSRSPSSSSTSSSSVGTAATVPNAATYKLSRSTIDEDPDFFQDQDTTTISLGGGDDDSSTTTSRPVNATKYLLCWPCNKLIDDSSLCNYNIDTTAHNEHHKNRLNAALTTIESPRTARRQAGNSNSAMNNPIQIIRDRTCFLKTLAGRDSYLVREYRSFKRGLRFDEARRRERLAAMSQQQQQNKHRRRQLLRSQKSSASQEKLPKARESGAGKNVNLLAKSVGVGVSVSGLKRLIKVNQSSATSRGGAASGAHIATNQTQKTFMERLKTEAIVQIVPTCYSSSKAYDNNNRRRLKINRSLKSNSTTESTEITIVSNLNGGVTTSEQNNSLNCSRTSKANNVQQAGSSRSQDVMVAAAVSPSKLMRRMRDDVRSTSSSLRINDYEGLISEEEDDEYENARDKRTNRIELSTLGSHSKNRRVQISRRNQVELEMENSNDDQDDEEDYDDDDDEEYDDEDEEDDEEEEEEDEEEEEQEEEQEDYEDEEDEGHLFELQDEDSDDGNFLFGSRHNSPERKKIKFKTNEINLDDLNLNGKTSNQSRDKNSKNNKTMITTTTTTTTSSKAAKTTTKTQTTRQFFDFRQSSRESRNNDNFQSNQASFGRKYGSGRHIGESLVASGTSLVEVVMRGLRSVHSLVPISPKTPNIPQSTPSPSINNTQASHLDDSKLVGTSCNSVGIEMPPMTTPDDKNRERNFQNLQPIKSDSTERDVCTKPIANKLDGGEQELSSLCNDYHHKRLNGHSREDLHKSRNQLAACSQINMITRCDTDSNYNANDSTIEAAQESQPESDAAVAAAAAAGSVTTKPASDEPRRPSEPSDQIAQVRADELDGPSSDSKP